MVSNRNELSIVNDMKSNLNQLKQEVTDSVSRQENRSFAFQRSLDEAKLTVRTKTVFQKCTGTVIYCIIVSSLRKNVEVVVTSSVWCCFKT